ncbi:hypothetical protein ROLI_015800 [Roseobacter fucihabitans]|uniref:Uncharacterized protein n=1 Tax=Roseobacter fucihabitans TaxID=1537242 RepID=A0ABZ2BR74_9RHOB|nr:hypothetical protein [Roseobacter litoralis]
MWNYPFSNLFGKGRARQTDMGRQGASRRLACGPTPAAQSQKIRRCKGMCLIGRKLQNWFWPALEGWEKFRRDAFQRRCTPLSDHLAPQKARFSRCSGVFHVMQVAPKNILYGDFEHLEQGRGGLIRRGH